jgi:mono/diheme cytochrome c family protein
MMARMKSICRLLVVLAASATCSLSAADAAANWKDHCATCHGDDGRGETKMGRKLFISDLTDAKLQAKFTDDEAANAIKHGLKDAKGKVIMKKIRGVSDAEVTALVAYVRSLKKVLPQTE